MKTNNKLIAKRSEDKPKVSRPVLELPLLFGITSGSINCSAYAVKFERKPLPRF